MKIVLVVVLGLIVAAGIALLVFYVAGSRMPREHKAVISATFPADRAAVWDAINDFDGMPGWWPAVKSTRLEYLADGTALTWNKDAHGNEIPFKTTELKPYNKLVRLIAATDQPFGGTWTFELADAPEGGTRLTLTEDGWIGPPVFRAVAKWIVGLDSNQRDFMDHLGKHLAAKSR
jgi:uncharacterized protein YndB with AHSA1/START domain